MPPDQQSERDWIYRLAVTEADGMYVYSSPKTETELQLPKEDLPMLKSAIESKLRFSVDYPANESVAVVTCHSTGTSIKVPFQEMAFFTNAVRELQVTCDVDEGEDTSQ